MLGGETADEVAARADRVIARARAADGDCLLFAHGHLLRMLGARWIDAPPTAGQHLLLSTAAVCVLGYERETPALARWNDTSHLDGLASTPDPQRPGRADGVASPKGARAVSCTSTLFQCRLSPCAFRSTGPAMC